MVECRLSHLFLYGARMHCSIEDYFAYLVEKGYLPLTIKAVRGDLDGFAADIEAMAKFASLRKNLGTS